MLTSGIFKGKADIGNLLRAQTPACGELFGFDANLIF